MNERPTDEYGRPYGLPLWPGGPILGGPKWETWLRAKRDRESSSNPFPVMAKRTDSRGSLEGRFDLPAK